MNNKSAGELIQGIDIQKLKEKYQPNRIDLKIDNVVEENRELFNSLMNEAAVENMRDFEADKIAQI